MRRIVGLLLLWPALLSAAEIKLAAGTWRGTAAVTVVVAADGTLTVTIDMSKPITITGGGIGGPVPPVDPPPTDPPLDTFRAAVRTATTAVSDPNKAASQAAVAELYTSLAWLEVTSRDQLVQATDAMWRVISAQLPQGWATWKVAVDKGLKPFEKLDEAKTAWRAVGEEVAK